MDMAFEALAVGAPRLDLDITLLIQMALFLGLWMLVRVKLVRPYLAARREREALTQGAREQASELDTRRDALLTRYQAQLAEAEAEAAALRATLMKEGSEHAQQSLQEAKSSASRELEQARASVAQERSREHARLDEGARALSKHIVEKLLPV